MVPRSVSKTACLPDIASTLSVATNGSRSAGCARAGAAAGDTMANPTNRAERWALRIDYDSIMPR